MASIRAAILRASANSSFRGFPMNDDPWIKGHSPIEPAKLHALGLVTFLWNSCEVSLFVLLTTVANTKPDIMRALTHEMTDAAMADRVRDLIKIKPSHPPELQDAIEYALDLFDANRINRNQLTHFMPSGGQQGIELWRDKGPTIEARPFPSEVADLRRVAMDLYALRKYSGWVANWVLAVNRGFEPPPSLEKPPLPDRLWKPPPPNQRARKPQPQS